MISQKLIRKHKNGEEEMQNIKMTTKMRPFTLEDAQEVVDLFNAHSQYLHGWDDCDLEEMINEWTSPGLDLNEVVRVVEDMDGKIIGYVEVWDTSQPHVIKYSWALLHPEAWDDALYREMLTWAEDCARSRIALAPQGARVTMSQGTNIKDHQRVAALEAYGYRLVRNFYRMMIEFDQAPPKPALPEGIVIVPIDIQKELKEAILAADEGFRDHWGYVERPIDEMLEQWQHHIANSNNFDPSLWFLAKEGDQIAGICYCAGKMTEDPEMAWVNQLAVRKPWRRRGLGMALLLHAFGEFYSRGKKRAGLGVDATSLTNATRLYEKAGMHVVETYNTYEFELRPGIEMKKT
jgi:GNAT superfamily N-acetyltransferase